MEPEESSGESELSFNEDEEEEDEDETMPAPFDVLPTEPEAEPPMGPENEIAGEIDYSVQIANDFSLPYNSSHTVLHLKNEICRTMTHLQPGDLNVYWRGEGEDETVRRRLRDTCLLSAIPMDMGDVVVINDGR